MIFDLGFMNEKGCKSIFYENLHFGIEKNYKKHISGARIYPIGNIKKIFLT